MMAGPAYKDAAEPVRTKMPAPMIAPMPSVIRLTGPRARFRLCSPVSPASFINASIGFVANKRLPMQLLLTSVDNSQVANDSSTAGGSCPAVPKPVHRQAEKHNHHSPSGL